MDVECLHEFRDLFFRTDTQRDVRLLEILCRFGSYKQLERRMPMQAKNESIWKPLIPLFRRSAAVSSSLKNKMKSACINSSKRISDLFALSRRRSAMR